MTTNNHNNHKRTKKRLNHMRKRYDKTQKKNDQPHDHYRDIRNAIRNIGGHLIAFSGQ
jgi:hypothetical protein